MGEGNKATLRQIVSERRALDELLMETGGEITDDQVEQTTTRWMAEIMANLAVKADSYQYRQQDIQTMAEQFKANAKMFSSAAKSLERVGESLKERLKYSMVEMQTNELAGILFKYKLSSSSPSVVIDDQALIPAIYCREKVVVDVDKAAIKDALLDGRSVPGAHLERGFTLRVSPNKKD